MKYLAPLLLFALSSCAVQRVVPLRTVIVSDSAYVKETASNLFTPTLDVLHRGDSITVIGRQYAFYEMQRSTGVGYVEKSSTALGDNGSRIVDLASPPTGIKSVIFAGIGGGGAGFSYDVGLVYKWIGLGVSGSFGEKTPGTTDAYPSEFLSSSSSTQQTFDIGYTSYELILLAPVLDALSIQGNVGYFTHGYETYRTTRDNDHILGDAVQKSGSYTDKSGVSWGVGMQLNIAPTIMIGAQYSSIQAMIGNVGFRF